MKLEYNKWYGLKWMVYPKWLKNPMYRIFNMLETEMYVDGKRLCYNVDGAKILDG